MKRRLARMQVSLSILEEMLKFPKDLKIVRMRETDLLGEVVFIVEGDGLKEVSEGEMLPTITLEFENKEELAKVRYF
jgi:hypothetical protein